MIQTHLKKLEEHLEEKDFMIGNSLTVVDLAYAITLGVLEAVDPDILLEFERVRNYFETCKESITGWEEVGASGLNLVRKWYNDCVDWTENGSEWKYFCCDLNDELYVMSISFRLSILHCLDVTIDND